MSREKINSLDNSDSINEYQSVENVLIFSLTFCRMQLVGKGILVAATDKINRTTKVCIFLLKTGSFRVKNSGFFSREIPPPRKWLCSSLLRVYGLLYLYRMVRIRLNLPLGDRFSRGFKVCLIYQRYKFKSKSQPNLLWFDVEIE